MGHFDEVRDKARFSGPGKELYGLPLARACPKIPDSPNFVANFTANFIDTRDTRKGPWQKNGGRKMKALHIPAPMFLPVWVRVVKTSAGSGGNPD